MLSHFSDRPRDPTRLAYFLGAGTVVWFAWQLATLHLAFERVRVRQAERVAVVRAEVGGRVRVKAVCGGSGYLCQMEPVAHFGLGREPRVGKVTVTSRSGTSWDVR